MNIDTASIAIPMFTRSSYVTPQDNSRHITSAQVARSKRRLQPAVAHEMGAAPQPTNA
jgi:hypothetical protein